MRLGLSASLQSPVPQRPLLLDVTGMPSAALAFSIRKLRTAYTGKALKVRRNSDDDEADVSFDSAGKVSLNSAITVTSGDYSGTMTLGAFTSSDYAYVKTWYDQSGNGKTLIPVAADSQPVLVYGGTLLAAPTFDGTDDYMDSNYEHESSNDDFTWNAVCKADAADQADGLMTDLRTFNQGCEVATASSNWNFKVEQHDLNTSQSVATSNQIILVSYNPALGSDNQVLRKNGTQEDRDEDEGILASQRSKFSVGARRSPIDYSYALNSPWDGTISEVVTWESALTTTQAGLVESNQSDYYGI